MWLYEKRLQYPVNVKRPDAKTAKIVMSQLGGPNGELEQKNLPMLKLLVHFFINLPMV